MSRATAPASVFLSHASTDKLAARVLGSALSRSGIAVWDYLDPAVDRLGDDLARVLADQVETADVFLLVLTPASAANPLVRREVEVALRRGLERDGRLLVLADERLARPWPAPFHALESTIFAAVDVTRLDALLPALARVVSTLGVRLAHGPELDTLPLGTRIFDELRRQPAVAQRAANGLAQAHFNHVLATVEAVTLAYVAEGYEEALRAARRLSRDITALYEDYEPYYPRLVEAVCCLHLHRTADAARVVEPLEQHPLCDESWHTLAGLIAAERGEATVARDHFEAARALCLAKGLPAVTTEIHLARIEDQLGVRNTRVISVAEGSSAALLDAERLAWARRLRRAGQLEPALRLLETVDTSEETAIEHAAVLVALDRADDAIAELRSLATAGASSAVYQHLARAHLAAGDLAAATGIYEQHLRRSGALLHEVEYARLLRLAGRRREMAASCEAVIVKRARHAEDAYAIGFASFLLGRIDQARADFARAAEYEGRWYGDVLADEADDGCARDEAVAR